MTFLELRVLGNFEARDKANQLVDVSAKKNRALLAILALSPSGWVPRQQLANLLWSDREDVHARSSLRQSLASLRKDLSAIDPSLVSADDEKLILDCAKVEIDAARFQRFATSDDVEVLRQAMSLYRGELLADTTIRDPAFGEWIASERARLHEIAVTILETLWAVERSGHRIDVAKRLVALDPLKESSHRALMQAYAEVGENARALQHYAACRDLLKAGYGIAPGNEIEELRQQILCQGARTAAPKGDPPSPEAMPAPQLSTRQERHRSEPHIAPLLNDPSIAVLPFMNDPAHKPGPDKSSTAVMKRKMAALMVGNVVGYPALMERAEKQTAERLASCHALILEKVGLLDGRVFKTTGDAALAEFQSAVNAVRSAVEIRGALAGAQESDHEPLRMRFGLHIADVMVRGDDLVGDGVNLAAWIQAAAEPDSIYVSAAFFDHVRRNSAFIFDDIGERAFRNISEPVHLYRVRGEMGPHRLQSAPTQLVAAKLRRPSSITVLPFRVSGGDDDQRYLAEGLTEELIVELGRFKRLSVSSRSASFSVSESKPDPVKVGDLLGVHYVLEGQLRRIGPRLSISLTLSETENGSVVWSGKISKPFEELFELVEKTTAKIGATVFGRIDEAGMVAARRKPPDNMTAFDYLLRGLDHHRRGGVTDDNARQAVAWFTKAIDADPNYAAAYAWRFCAGSWLGDFDLEQGRRDVCRALELDPCDAEANRIMGVVALMDRNFDEALAHHRRAMELNPTDAYIKARCAAVFTFVGEAERALSLLDEAEMLDPFLPVWCIEERGVALFALGRHAEALESLGQLTFQTNRSRLYRVAALVTLGRTREAQRIVREAVGAKSDLTASGFTRSEHYRDSEKAQELGRLLREAGLPV